MWILFGALSAIFTLLNMFLAFKENRKIWWTSLCALAFTILTMLSEYAMINNWVLKQDWSALMDVVPAMYMILKTYALIVIGVNTAAIFIYGRKKNTNNN